MKFENIYTLNDRGILYIHGQDATAFLQNIISNNIEKVTDKSSIFSSLLTPQGKYLFDFLIIKHKNGFIFDVEKKQIDELYQKLNLYKLRSKVEILNLSNEFVVASISKEKFLSFENSKNIEGYTIKYREDSIFLDPRNLNLGARLIINLEKLYLSIKKLNLKPGKSDEYYELSYKLGIPQRECDKLKDKIFGIECNFEELNAIDFKKGCYVGQENTARIKLKNKLSKRLLPIKILKGSSKINENIYLKNEICGKILLDGVHPFGLIKMKSGQIDFSEEYKSENSIIKILKPDWIKI